MVVNVPPMGWNSWNTFNKNINEQLIRDTADKMVSEGLLDCGYEYLVIDDCWARRSRVDGKLVADPEKFPNGIKAVADYVHSKGLKFGIYSCAGMLTCAGYPSSYDHEFVDAATFAEWGVDFLKYDYCYKPQTVSGDVLYKRMGAALANCGRDILFSACTWGTDETKKWIKTTGAHMWRYSGDIENCWNSLKDISMRPNSSIKYSAPNCFCDLDMMTVGMKSDNGKNMTGCTEDEFRLEFSLWAMLGAPLMMGCDVRNLDDSARSILMNRDVIAIDRDPACNQAFPLIGKNRYEDDYKREKVVYARLLENGDYAIGIFNLSDEDFFSFGLVQLDTLGLNEGSGKTLLMRELWTGETVKAENGVYGSNVPPHSCKLFRCKVVDI